MGKAAGETGVMATVASPSNVVQMHRAKEAQPIMETNNSSIVSKRSVEQKFYPPPHFLRYFVHKRKNRSPLINRGYWLRMKCIEHTVRTFCAEATRPTVIINLGAGFDALPFRLLATEAQLCQSTIFVDVDYDELIASKVKKVLEESTLSAHLGQVVAQDRHQPLQLCTERYWAVGCDLHDIGPLQRIVAEKLGNASDYEILMISEVATCYMEPGHVDALIAWAASLGNAAFCLLEQHLPCGALHPFAETMLGHFSKLRSPLRSIEKYSTIEEQRARFLHLGWTNVHVKSLWEIWCADASDGIVSPENRNHLDATEPFDEWEELALFTGHYFLLVATSKTSPSFRAIAGPVHKSAMNKPISVAAEASVRNILSLNEKIPPRRFGALYSSKQGELYYHGGYSNSRLDSTLILGKNKNQATKEALAPANIQPRMCHTITELNEEHDLLLVGGRGSPDRAFSDCWLRWRGKWTQTRPLPAPLYRHCAILARLDAHSNGVLVVGGKTKGGCINPRCYLWQFSIEHESAEEQSERCLPEGKWHEVKIRSEETVPGRFAAMIGSINGALEGLLVGGLGEGGTTLARSYLIWKLSQNKTEWNITLKPLILDVHPDSESWGRFGGQMATDSDGYYVVGGVGYNGPLTCQQQILRIDNPKVQANEIAESSILSYVAGSPLPSLLVGHSIIQSNQTIFIVGGGAICFSFGTYHNEAVYYIPGQDGTLNVEFDNIREELSSPDTDFKDKTRTSKGLRTTSQLESDGTEKQFSSIPFQLPVSADDFSQIVRAARPIGLRGLDFGPCVAIWTPEHLVEMLGSKCVVSIHRAESAHMSFQPEHRNFKYVDCTFGEFIESILSGGREYFRALSRQSISTPANIWRDYPLLASEFSIPPILHTVMDHHHSAVLRISGPVSIWLHYDVLANVLVQIRGTKTMILFPPSDVSLLDIPPGESSSNIDVSTLLSHDNPILSRAHPHKVVLNPGDALFIPPLWPHCATPNEGVSVSVNVFFRDLSEGYAPGRDVYANRDIQAYEDGRRDLAKIINRFRTLPGPAANFYLQRLGNELAQNAARFATGNQE